MKCRLACRDALWTAEIIHGDVKGVNILYDGAVGSNVQLADYGLSLKITPGHVLTGARWTPYYQAPELLTAPFEFDEAIDIWAAGCVLYRLLGGLLPFWHVTGKDLYMCKLILHCQLWVWGLHFSQMFGSWQSLDILAQTWSHTPLTPVLLWDTNYMQHHHRCHLVVICEPDSQLLAWQTESAMHLSSFPTNTSAMSAQQLSWS